MVAITVTKPFNATDIASDSIVDRVLIDSVITYIEAAAEITVNTVDMLGLIIPITAINAPNEPITAIRPVKPCSSCL